MFNKPNWVKSTAKLLGIILNLAAGDLSQPKYRTIMSRRKRTSAALTLAENRAIGLSKIDPKLDLGKGNSLALLQASITTAQQLLDSYNTKLSDLDVVQNDLASVEDELKQRCSLFLTSVGVNYGKDSNEYELAGGKRKSERKSPVRKAKTTAASK